jgi:hypothetical protein
LAAPGGSGANASLDRLSTKATIAVAFVVYNGIATDNSLAGSGDTGLVPGGRA